MSIKKVPKRNLKLFEFTKENLAKVKNEKKNIQMKECLALLCLYYI